MKVQLIPLYFDPGRDAGFDTQLTALRELLGDQVEFKEPVALGDQLPPADAVIFPQLLGEGYRKLEAFRDLDLPILIVTSEFGTLSMWDWELISYLRLAGVVTIAPYTFAQTLQIVAALRVKRELGESKFLVYQDNPGDGQQASIFKRFYWWESECTQRIAQKFGLSIEKRSYRDLGARAKSIPDDTASALRQGWEVPHANLSDQSLNSATKLYMAMRQDLDKEPLARGVGINCLNESHFSDTTPCLAFSQLYEEDGFIWGCEADTVSMLTKFILHRSLNAPIMMTNLYPFALGDAALKHERISHFPAVTRQSKDYLLLAHCGYMGVIPPSFATEWILRERALGIVDENATAIDARMAVGDITLAKMQTDFAHLTVAEGELEGYAQYPDSDCRNGGVVHVADGHRLLSRLSSHHALLMTGARQAEIEMIAPIFDVSLEAF